MSKILLLCEENDMRFASMCIREEMFMIEQSKSAESFGAPLAICINDCEIDYGQSYAELQRICFRLRCAFAEMRWGNDNCGLSDPSVYAVPEFYQIEPREDRR